VLEKFEKVVVDKPHAFLGALAIIYNNIASLCILEEKWGDAEKWLEKCRDIIFREPFIRWKENRPSLTYYGAFYEVTMFLLNYIDIIQRRDAEKTLEYLEYAIHLLREYSLGIMSYIDLTEFINRYNRLVRKFVNIVVELYRKNESRSFLINAVEMLEELKYVPLIRDLSQQIMPEDAEKIRMLESEIADIISRMYITRCDERRYLESLLLDKIKELDKCKAKMLDIIRPPKQKMLSGVFRPNTLFISMTLLEIRKSNKKSTVRYPFIIWISEKYSGCRIVEIPIDEYQDQLFQLQEIAWSLETLKQFMTELTKHLPRELLEALDNAILEKSTIILSLHGPSHDIPWEAIDPSIVLGGEERPIGLRTLVIRLYGGVIAQEEPESLQLKPLIIGVERPCPKSYNCDAEVLPGISEEVKAIGSLLNVDPYIINGQSLEDARNIHREILSSINKATVFYFSGHGFSETPTPLSTINYLLFFRGGKTDLRIFPSDIMLRDKPGFLAFLNACRTGRGAEGRSILDFRGGFIHSLIGSGFRTVILSLWSVWSKTAKTFALELFRRLKSADASEAIISARKEILKYGALFGVDVFAFVIYGDIEGLEELRKVIL